MGLHILEPLEAQVVADHMERQQPDLETRVDILRLKEILVVLVQIPISPVAAVVVLAL